MDSRDCPSEEIFQSFVDRRLDPAAVAELHEHVSGCDGCRQLLAELAPEPAPDPAEALSATLPSQGEAPAAAAVPGPAVGATIAGYRLLRILGSGGMGIVYEGFHDQIGRRAAIKVLRLDEGEGGGEAQRQAFLREARAANVVEDPSIVQVYDAGRRPSGGAYIIMEYLEGETLADRLERLGASLLPLLQQAAAGLAAAHDKGVIHRDLKPGNVMVVRDPLVPGGERVKILDFGLAKLAGDSQRADRTRTGAVMGTPLYMSPEQCRSAAQVDGKTDVYSLGVMLYEALAGRPPFGGEGPAEVMACHLRDPPPPLGAVAPQVPPALAALVHRMLEKDPAARPTIREVAASLSAHAGAPGSVSATVPDVPAEPPRPAPPRRLRRPALVLLGACLAGALGVGLALGLRRPPEERMVRLPGGAFRMGSTPPEIEAAFFYCKGAPGNLCERPLFEREGPQHEVRLSPFQIDATEVTNGRFAAWLNDLLRRGAARVREERWVETAPAAGEPAVLLADVYPTYQPTFGILYEGGRLVPSPGFDRRPASQLTWQAAWRYCAAQGKRLPTEAEWELAARGTEGRRFPWGYDEPRCRGVVVAREPRQGCEQEGLGPRDVASSSQDVTPAGIYDLGGNVSEWVADAFQERYRPCEAGPCADPLTLAADAGYPGARSLRGGNWKWSGAVARAASRSQGLQDFAALNTGFRCARGVPLGEAARPAN